MKSKFFLRLFVIAAAVWLSALLGKEDEFRPFNLPISGEMVGYHSEDLTGDYLSEIVIYENHKKSDGKIQRVLSIFVQDSSGFLSQPIQKFSLPDEATLFDFGEVDSSGNRALVFFAMDGIYYHSWTDTGFSSERKKLLSTPSIFLYPDADAFREWDFVSDFNGDYIEDILVQQFDKCQFFTRNQNNGEWKSYDLKLLPYARPFAYFDPRFSVGSRAGTLYATPYLRRADFNADDKTDLIAVYKDSLVVFEQKDDKCFWGKPDQVISINHGDIWSGAKIMRTHLDDSNERHFLMRIIDVNNDKILDLVTSFISTKESLINPKSETRVYLGKKNGAGKVFYSDVPEQIITPSGTQMVLDTYDFNKDGQMDFLIPCVNIGLMSVIKMLMTKTVDIEAELFIMRGDGKFEDSATRKTKINVRFSFRGGAASPIYEIADFNGDGYYDILCSADEQKLMIYWGNDDTFIESAAGAKFMVDLPQDGTLVRAMDLNNDKKSDVVIQYSESDLQVKKRENGLQILLKN